MKVVIVGSGNVATVLGKAIQIAGHTIVQILGRNESTVYSLAEKFKCKFGDFKSGHFEEADIYLLAISDTGLHHIDQHIQLEEKLIVHTAASVSKDVLKNISSQYGILYPLQSLNKELNDLLEIPFLIDGNNENTIFKISQFANTISDKVVIANDDERLAYHIAAIFANNFTNHLFALAENFCKKENIDFQLLYPLIDSTVQKIKINSPALIQTGPAMREDIYTLGKHLHLLSAYPDLKYIYLKLSESILKNHNKDHSL